MVKEDTRNTIIIPFFNESSRIPLDEYKDFLDISEVHLILVNDASSDNTGEKLNSLKESYPNRIDLLTNDKNKGKGYSVRRGILYGLEHIRPGVIGFLDADLATSFEEYMSLASQIGKDKKFVFGSRILRIGSTIERRFSRFLIGRIIATFISNILDLKVYDTQCGCKVFEAEVARILFRDSFISKWLFDVELFSRIVHQYGKENAIAMMEEIPLKKWVDQGESKVRPLYFFRLWLDLWRIRSFHRNGLAKT